jgi:hypothetical protein
MFRSAELVPTDRLQCQMSGGSHVRPYSKRARERQRCAASLTDPQHINEADTGPEPSLRKAQTGVHRAAIEVALAAALWFIPVTWISFARGMEVDWDLVVDATMIGLIWIAVH